MKRSSLALLVLLAACATLPGVHQFERRADIGAPFGVVWDALIDTFGENSWSINTIERDSGIITTDWMRIESSHMDCGSSGLNSDRSHQVRFNVIVREAPGGSTMTVNTTWQVFRSFNNVGDWTDCTSRGSIERVIHDMVREKVA